MKTIEKIGEFGLIEFIRKKTSKGKSVLVGIGDDAAIVRASRRYQLFATDLLVENVDFSFRTATPEQIGRKALAINLSDIAAMGGSPESAMVGLVIPRRTKFEVLDQFYRGMLKLAKEFGVSIVGGDLSRGPCWMIAVSIFGNLPFGKGVLRKGARPGDLICVTGDLGGSIARKHLVFVPRVREGRFLAKTGAHAMIDISDGLIQDLTHVLHASKVGGELWLEKIPVSRTADQISRGNAKKALLHALTDGEDFELLFTISERRFKRLKLLWQRRFQTQISVIGRIVSGKSKLFFVRDSRKVHLSLRKMGYQHFA